MKPLKDAYNQRCNMWIRANARSRITDYDIAGLVSETFTKVARLDIAAPGFKCTGICPFDRHLFSDFDYMAADMTNIPLGEPGTSSIALGCGREASEQCNNLVTVESTDPPKQSTNKPRISSLMASMSFNPDVIHKLSLLPDAAKNDQLLGREKLKF